ncbi:MAG: T9SS type A sorting domain-containing protein [Saprospiraceae bacterium]|nr:T9SS type A sorting domain-containing protein [Saprospiraceae bacterium]
MQKIYILFLLIVTLPTMLQSQVTWDNFEDIRKGTYGFINGSFIPYNENPDQSGVNTSRVAAQYTRNAAEQFDVLILDAAMADLSDYVSGTKQISIDVWSPVAGKVVQITLENDVLAQPANYPTGRHSVYLATTSVANAWETLTFSFDSQPDASVANNNVNRFVLLFDPGSNNGDTYYLDNITGPEFANDVCDGVIPDPEVFNDFECNQHTDFVFSHSGINFRRVVNPDQTGNESDYVATYTRNGGEEYDVIIGYFDGNLALESNSTIALDVWDPTAPTEVIVSLQNANNDVILEMTATTSTSNTWETLTYNPSSVSDAPDIAKFVILFDPAGFSSDNYFFDNFGFGIPTSVTDLQDVVSFEAFPNPTSGITTFRYELDTSADVQLSIYDMTGKQLALLADENQGAGPQQIIWDATDFASGMYFYTLSVNGKFASGKITLNR